ncbi:hypothetical protein CEXT_688761 [Caerostris extrusa]|uniref:Uncharacterized protein n=1 Tax=Caerostris extrusa TaxID=172846 RepID=A0AAV4PRD8_CAEEX|nr:hypothetical protein CEXT_688761 [Caerostris extrusa]
MSIVQDVPKEENPKIQLLANLLYDIWSALFQLNSSCHSTPISGGVEVGAPPPGVSGQVSTAVLGSEAAAREKGWFKPNLPQVDCCKSMKCLPFDITDFPAVDCYFTRGVEG